MREREKQHVSEWPRMEELVQRTAEGWRLVAIDWERDVDLQQAPTAAPLKIQEPEIPYGFRVSPDGFHLVNEPSERHVLKIILNSIVDDRPLSQAAMELNRAGLLNREGREWTVSAVFDLLPRLIEAGPAIFASDDWIADRDKRRKSVA